MLYGDPVISMKVDPNTFAPTVLFCPPDSNNKIEVQSGTYIDADEKSEADLIGSFNDFQVNNITCKLFNETLFTNKPKESIGGSYNFTFISSINAIAVNVKDFSNSMNNMMMNMSPTHVDIHSDVGIQLVTGGLSELQYIETRYVDLDGGKAHRGFQLITLASIPTNIVTAQTVMNIIIYAQDCVMVNSENPSLNLATFLGNLGGYLSICGVFGFLFGRGKVRPFGFVTDNCFPDQDKESLRKHLYNDNDNDNDQEKVTTVTESKTLLTEYYIDTELFSK
ncbi:hypothetical protein GLOIN_2v1843415 [Rhizophagus clarus]|nr:hypothetical protein GLOIN_2v1843415 [Rhizophagus clarus]